MKDRKQALLWRVEGAATPGPSYLFGTMHVRDRRAFGLLPPVQACIDRCAVFATEFDLDAIGLHFDPQLLLLPGGLTLDRLIGPRKYDKLRRILFKSVGLDIHPFRDKQPILLANMVDERILARDMPYALDEVLWRYARSQEKRLTGIETYGEQLAILGKIPVRQQAAALLAIGRQVGRHRRHLKAMTRLYEEGRIGALYRATRRGAGGLRHLLIDDRNEVMARRIGDLVREHTSVCAVGAGHLAGSKGLLRLLKHQGLCVHPEPMPTL